MLVVSDATPLNVLIRAELVDILPRLFSNVLIPSAVADELSHERTPEPVRLFMLSPPPWLQVRAPTSVDDIGPRGLGERQAIALALEVRADLLLADDKAARRAAIASGIATVGTLGVLEAASQKKLVDMRVALTRVRAQASSSLLASFRRHSAAQTAAPPSRNSPR